MGQASDPGPAPRRQEGPRLLRRLATAALAAAGVALFWLLDLPLPFLFGPMVACLVAALLGAPLLGTGVLAIAARTVVGVAIGSSLTPQVLHTLPQMLASVALIPLYIGTIALVGVPFFVRVCGFDRVTAYYAAMPGGQAEMAVLALVAGADLGFVVVHHVTRVLLVIAGAPIAARVFRVRD
jgi:membrane AbrB-like protein